MSNTGKRTGSGSEREDETCPQPVTNNAETRQCGVGVITMQVLTRLGLGKRETMKYRVQVQSLFL